MAAKAPKRMLPLGIVMLLVGIAAVLAFVIHAPGTDHRPLSEPAAVSVSDRAAPDSPSLSSPPVSDELTLVCAGMAVLCGAALFTSRGRRGRTDSPVHTSPRRPPLIRSSPPVDRSAGAHPRALAVLRI